MRLALRASLMTAAATAETHTWETREMFGSNRKPLAASPELEAAQAERERTARALGPQRPHLTNALFEPRDPAEHWAALAVYAVWLEGLRDDS